MHGGVGEEADALDTQVGQDLAAEADGAEDAAGAGLGAFAGAQLLMVDEAAGLLRIGRDRGAFRVEGSGGDAAVNIGKGLTAAPSGLNAALGAVAGV